MTHRTIIFGGLGVSKHVLGKFAAVYGPRTQIIPFTFTCMLTREHYRPYRALHESMLQHGGPIHIHVLSGACHYVHRFITLFPEHRARVISQVYDSPCHVDGVVPSLKKMYRAPLPLGRAMVRTIFADCVETSNRWVACTPFDASIPTGFVTSTCDAIVQPDTIETIIRNWRCSNQRTMVTDSRHLESLRDYPEQYKTFCVDVYERGDIDGWRPPASQSSEVRRDNRESTQNGVILKNPWP